MLANPTIDKLQSLGLSAMAAGLSDQLAAPGTFAELSFEDRLGLLVDKEADARDSRRLAARLKAAKLRYPAAIEDLDWHAPRGLKREVVEERAQRRSTLVASQLPVEAWHGAMSDPTLAEAILDRLLQASHRIALQGPSLRKPQPEALATP